MVDFLSLCLMFLCKLFGNFMQFSEENAMHFLCFSSLLSSALFYELDYFGHCHVLTCCVSSSFTLSLFFIVLSVSPATKIFTHASTSSTNTIKRFFETNWFQLFRVFEQDPHAALLAKMIHICRLISTFFNITRFCSSLHSS